jgi:hypothetical protein
VTAGELAIGAQFTLREGGMVFTVVERWPSHVATGRLTRCTSENRRLKCIEETMFNAQTIVIQLPVSPADVPPQSSPSQLPEPG